MEVILLERVAKLGQMGEVVDVKPGYARNYLLTKGKALRGGMFDVFGRTEERRMERELITQYEARMRELLPQLSAERIKLAADIAAVPLTMRGFGHVKQANVVLARDRAAHAPPHPRAGLEPRRPARRVRPARTARTTRTLGNHGPALQRPPR